MIRVVLYGHAAEGRFSYKVWTENTRLSAPLEGLSATPLFDACRRLKELGAAGDNDVIGLFDDSGKYDNQFRLKTTVAYGAKMMARPEPIPSPEPPPEEAVEATGAKSAKPEAPPPPRTPPASPAGRDQDLPKPPKPGPTHHRPKPRASGGRRGQR